MIRGKREVMEQNLSEVKRYADILKLSVQWSFRSWDSILSTTLSARTTDLILFAKKNIWI